MMRRLWVVLLLCLGMAVFGPIVHAQSNVTQFPPGRSNPVPYLLNAPIFWDDFISAKTNTTGDLGWLGWQIGGTAAQAQISGRPGVATITAAATGFAEGYLFNGDLIQLSNVDTVTFICAWGTGASQPDSRVGLWSTNTAAVPSDDAVYFEREAADTNWFAVTRDGAAANQTRTDTNIAYSANTFYTLDIRHPIPGQWDFYINGSLVASRTTGNIPAEATYVIPNFQIETNGTALAVSIDWFFLQLLTAR